MTSFGLFMAICSLGFFVFLIVENVVQRSDKKRLVEMEDLRVKLSATIHELEKRLPKYDRWLQDIQSDIHSLDRAIQNLPSTIADEIENRKNSDC